MRSYKPILYAANVTDAELSGEEGPHIKKLRDAITASGEHAEVVPFSAKIEAELAELSAEDRAGFLESLGLESAGLDRLIRAGYHLLGLQTYFTAGEQEVRAWTIHNGDTAPQAAGVIHTDFERGFIRAETVSFEDFVNLGGWKPAREKGAVRSEGKEYVVHDGDVMLFRFNVRELNESANSPLSSENGLAVSESNRDDHRISPGSRTHRGHITS